jgi:tellurite resistance protein TerC
MQVSPWVWLLFALMVLALLAVDLGVFRASRRAPQEVTLRSAAWWSAAWIGLGLVFALVISVLYGMAPALTYLTAYLLEKSLSVDNIFVFVLIFAAVRILWGREKKRELVATACAVCGSWVARIIPITPVPRGGSFWVRERGRLIATPIFIALIVVETTDVIFALDSIPAVFAVTRDLLLVYTSNVFAMLGLRSLYFLLAGVVDRFRFLRSGLAVILVFVGVKLLSSGVVQIHTWISLAVIAAALTLAVTASVAIPRKMAPLPASGDGAPRR